ncbi:MBL fold metallo-hydrolase [Streptomyces sp. SCSIO 75703]|uniref:MBL fold metallo-hydrolase n=1 Tax=unclassified Streptomyces TaxID=2593676 RepID=UPI0004BEB320|nr:MULTISPECIES: MBL fold metallo-hydrolase [unclassified Streptomyces]
MTVTWEEPGWERITAHVVRRRLPGWDCTVGLVLGAGGVLAVDAGSCLAEGAGVRAWAERTAGARVTHLALTHAHFDHVLGAGAFPDARVYGAPGVGAALTGGREELVADAVAHGLDARAAREAADALPGAVRETEGEVTLDLGGGARAVLAAVGPGHTGHDLAVLVPGDPAVVLCGDLVEESGPPQAGPDAVPSRWPAALDRLLALGGEDARYVPGHGAVVDAAFVRAQRDALAVRFGVSR